MRDRLPQGGFGAVRLFLDTGQALFPQSLSLLEEMARVAVALTRLRLLVSIDRSSRGHERKGMCKDSYRWGGFPPIAEQPRALRSCEMQEGGRGLMLAPRKQMGSHRLEGFSERGNGRFPALHACRNPPGPEFGRPAQRPSPEDGVMRNPPHHQSRHARSTVPA
jgi:hypothetical protein